MEGDFYSKEPPIDISSGTMLPVAFPREDILELPAHLSQLGALQPPFPYMRQHTPGKTIWNEPLTYFSVAIHRTSGSPSMGWILVPKEKMRAKEKGNHLNAISCHRTLSCHSETNFTRQYSCPCAVSLSLCCPL